jgi:hypothetical protein
MVEGKRKFHIIGPGYNLTFRIRQPFAGLINCIFDKYVAGYGLSCLKESSALLSNSRRLSCTLYRYRKKIPDQDLSLDAI